MTKLPSLVIAAAVALGAFAVQNVRADEPGYYDMKEPLGVLIERYDEKYRLVKKCRFYPDKKNFKDPYKRDVSAYYAETTNFDIKEAGINTFLHCKFYKIYSPPYPKEEKKFKCLIVKKVKYYDKYVDKKVDSTDKSRWEVGDYYKAEMDCHFQDDYKKGS